jgi:ribonuclease P protein component
MRLSGAFFDVYISPPRAGKSASREVSVGTKVAKKAVDRNKLKRRLREILRASAGLDGKNVRVVALKGASALKFEDIKKDLDNIFSKL